MGLNLSNLETVLQSKVDGLTSSSTDKDVLLTSKSIEAATADVTVADVITEGGTQVTAINNAASTKVGEVNTAGGTQVTAVNNAGTAQIALVNAIDTYTKAETDAKIVELAPKEVLAATSNPAVAAEGVLFYNTTTDVLNVSDGSAWNPVYEPPARGTEQNPATSMGDLKSALETVPDGDYWFISTNSTIGTTTFRVESEWIVIPLVGDATVSGAAAAGQSSYWNNASRAAEYAFGTAGTDESSWEGNNRWYYYDNSGPNTGLTYVIYDLGMPFRYVKIASTWQTPTASGGGGGTADWGSETGSGNIGTAFTSYSDHPFELYPNGSGTSMTTVGGNTDAFSSLIASGGWVGGEKGNSTISWTSNTIDTGLGNNRTEIGFGAAGGNNEDYRLNSSKWYIK